MVMIGSSLACMQHLRHGGDREFSGMHAASEAW
jgi:hypothetical protein